jgi:hypothetical protein
MSFDDRLSLQEAVAGFYILKASDLLRMESFSRRQEVEMGRLVPEDCHLLLFISHRWEATDHPDPSGRQLAALKSLVLSICDACDALAAESAEERLRLLPTLSRYGTLQAVLLVARLSSSLLSMEFAIANRSAREWLPDHIGVWYDFTCLPQEPRTENEEREFQEALLALPNLLLSDEISLVAIRDEGDDYEARGWCFAEARMAAEKMVFRSLVLRLDRLETTSPTEILSFNHDGPGIQFKRAMEAWERNGTTATEIEACWKIIVSQACIAPDNLPFSEADTPVLSLDRMVQPSIKWVALLLVDLVRQPGHVIDFSERVLLLLKEQGLHCSIDDDLIYVGLLALVWTCQEQSRIAEFFRQCLTRHIRKQRLLIRIMVSGTTATQNNDGVGLNSENLIWEFI